MEFLKYGSAITNDSVSGGTSTVSTGTYSGRTITTSAVSELLMQFHYACNETAITGGYVVGATATHMASLLNTNVGTAPTYTTTTGNGTVCVIQGAAFK